MKNELESNLHATSGLIARMLCAAAVVCAFPYSLAFAAAAEPGTPPPAVSTPSTLAARTAGLKRFDGLLPMFWSEAEGKLFLEIPKGGPDLLYLTTLTQGLGSNDVGLDRGQISEARLVRFERIGPKVLLVQPNLEFRADTRNDDERRAVEESFAQSVLYGFKVEAEDDAHVLVDATAFALRDGHDAIGSLKRAEQGAFALDAERSAIYLPGTQAFPRNTEIEVTLTLKGDAPGQFVKDVTPTPEAVSIRERYSFIALPEPGYVPRIGVPGDGFFEATFADYATPLGDPLIKHFIVRHRLEKKDPTAAVSEAVKPIVYYVDRGAPQPIRDALIEGGRWWNQAFEAAGYKDAFRVEVLPDGADLMDVRYNMVQWVHRATRGWSYGHAINDPRTGEIIKGNVTLGSLRARYDWLIAEGLLSPYGVSDTAPPEVQQLVLARLRQLAAHEIGHTLGLAHNYVGSAQGRSSVMDYPQPLVKLEADGSVDIADAYATGIGDWDKVAIDYGYRQFPAGGDDNTKLAAILAEARGRGLSFLTDEDARPAGAAHPDVSLWDNGRDSADELRRMMTIRKAALARFGDNAVRRGMPEATIEEALVPLYLYHRYQIDATAKALGGQRYVHALRGDGQTPVADVSAAEQRKALDALLETLSPEALVLSPTLLARIPPRPATWPATRELFPRTTAPTFDALAPAVAASNITIGAILQSERSARIAQQHARDASLPGLDAVIDRVIATTFDSRSANGAQAEVLRAEQIVVVKHLMALARNASSPDVRAMAALELDGLRLRLNGKPAARTDASSNAQRFLLVAMIRRFSEHPEVDPHEPAEPMPPPGSPLGD